ncbi:MAG: L,D-transpeptidase family protein [Calditrichia bacterium]
MKYSPRYRNIVTMVLMILIGALASCGKQDAKSIASPISDKTDQLILVVAESMDSAGAQLFRFERRQGNGWQSMAESVPAMIGKNGLGWGIGEHPEALGEIRKVEGDGKAPAGAFFLDSVFGFIPADSVALKMPYLHVTEALECVDDAKSRFYNRIVSKDTIAEVDWKSSEKMREIGTQYHLGITVRHNDAQLAGSGSCIFLHIWGGPGDSTIGCTAMDKDVLQRIVNWLDMSATPMLIQLTQVQYKTLRDSWQLPAIIVE